MKTTAVIKISNDDYEGSFRVSDCDKVSYAGVFRHIRDAIIEIDNFTELDAYSGKVEIRITREFN